MKQLPLFPSKFLLPKTYGDCIGAKAQRISGETHCRHYTCRHNLIGELTRMREGNAIKAMIKWKRGEIKASCVLDIAEEEWTEAEAAALFGVGIAPYKEYLKEAMESAGMEFEE